MAKKLVVKKLEKRGKVKRQAVFTKKSEARWAETNVDIKRWKPVHEQMVQLNVMGYTAQQIRDFVVSAGGREYSLTNIYKVLNSLQAQAVKAKILERIQGSMEQSSMSKIHKIADRAIDNIEAVIGNEKLLEDNPLAVFDKSLQIVKGIGKLNKEHEGGPRTPQVNVNVGVGLSLDNNQLGRLQHSLRESNEVLEKHFLGKGDT